MLGAGATEWVQYTSIPASGSLHSRTSTLQIISRRTLGVSVCLVVELLSGSEALQQKDGEEQERDEKLFAEPVLLGYTELGVHIFYW